jgi:DNA-binding MarR family transcriptional regulator
MSPSATASAAIPQRFAPQREPAVPGDDAIWGLLDAAGLSQQIGFMMRLAQLALLEQAASKQKNIDISISQMIILQLVHTQPGLSQQRIADAIRIKKANLTPLINDLVSAGLITRQNSTMHRKAYALHLTREGEKSLRKATKTASNQTCFTAHIFAPDERQQFIRSLHKIAHYSPPRRGSPKKDLHTDGSLPMK